MSLPRITVQTHPYTTRFFSVIKKAFIMYLMEYKYKAEDSLLPH